MLTVHERVIVALLLPAASVARTLNVWGPLLSPEYVPPHPVVTLSSVHDSVPSFAEIEKLAVVEDTVDPCAGPPPRDATGATVSTVHDRDAGVASSLPLGSSPRT